MPTEAPDLRIAIMRLARRLRNQRADDTMTASQMAALGTLLREGPLPPGELAAAEHVQPPSMTRILSSLQSAGLVTRAPHPTDGRQVIYAATDEARAMVQRDRQRRDHWLTQRMSQLTPEQRATLEAAVPILDRLARD
ncbi:MAG: MarR family transcriptional regulator [Micrococcales bacterium]|nr:MarR family transcriptional regulator [Micrococcales bacterium]